MKAYPLRSRGLLRLFLLSVSVFGSLFMAEIAARTLIWRDDREVISESLLDPLPAPKDTWAGAWHVIRLSPNPHIVFELKPNLVVNFMGAHMKTNSAGFRGPERRAAKPPDCYRIVALGDSVGMGWRLHDGDELMALAETYLNKKFPSRRWEMINTSVLGYNTAQELETLKTKGLQYKPDLVIVNYCRNDIELPSFVRQRRNYFQLNHLFLVEFLKDRLGLQRRHSGLLVIDPCANVSREVLTNPKLVPPDYADMVGWENARRLFAELKELSVREHFAVLVVFYPDYVQDAAVMAQQQGFQVLNTAPLLKRFMSRNHIPKWAPPMCVNPIDTNPDGHPSRLANMVVLGGLLQAIGRIADQGSHQE